MRKNYRVIEKQRHFSSSSKYTVKDSPTFWQLSSQSCELLWVFQELHHFLQLILSFLYPFDMFKCHVFHLDRVYR